MTTLFGIEINEAVRQLALEMAEHSMDPVVVADELHEATLQAIANSWELSLIAPHPDVHAAMSEWEMYKATDKAFRNGWPVCLFQAYIGYE